MKDIRIIQVDDNCSVAYFRPHPVTREDIDKVVARYSGGSADVIVFEVANVDICSFRSKVNEMVARDWSDPGSAESVLPPRNLWNLVDNGVHLPAAYADAVHAHGFQFWPGMRSNTSKHTTRLKEEHPDWLLPTVNYTRPGMYDYEVPEVRAHVLAQMRELVETCDADGFYFNLMRCFFTFHPDRAAQCADLMTGWMGDIRQMLDEVAGNKGIDRLPFAVQVQARVQDNTYQGHDVWAWAQEGFVDYLCPARDNHIDFNLPMEQWLEVVEGTNCRFFPVVQPALGYSYTEPTPEHFRALFHSYLRGGAHGLSTMNILCRPEIFRIFEEFGDEGKLARGQRHYHFSGPPLSSRDGDLDFPLQPGLHPHDFEFVVREDSGDLANATLHFTLAGVHPDDEFTYGLNGVAIPNYVEYDGYAHHPYRAVVGGALVVEGLRDYRYTVPLKDLPMNDGVNRLTLGAGFRPPGVSGRVHVRSVEVIL